MAISKKKITTNLTKEEIEQEDYKNKVLSKEEHSILTKFFDAKNEDEILFTPAEINYLLDQAYEFDGPDMAGHKSALATKLQDAQTSVHMKKIICYVMNRLVDLNIDINCYKPAGVPTDKYSIYTDVELVPHIPADIERAIDYIAEHKDKIEKELYEIEPIGERNIKMMTTNMKNKDIESARYKSMVLSKEEYSMLHKFAESELFGTEVFFNADELRHLFANCYDYDHVGGFRRSEVAEIFERAMYCKETEMVMTFIANKYLAFDIDFCYNPEAFDENNPDRDGWIPVTTEVSMKVNLPYDLAILVELLSEDKNIYKEDSPERKPN